MKKYTPMLISFFQTIVFNSRCNRQTSIAPANLRLMIFLCGLFLLLASQISISAQSYTTNVFQSDRGSHQQINSSGSSSTNNIQFVGTEEFSCTLCGIDYYRERNFFPFNLGELSANETVSNDYSRLQNTENTNTTNTSTALMAPTSELLVNGGFESGTLAGWTGAYSGCTDNGSSYGPANAGTSFSPGFGGVTLPFAGTRALFHGWACGPQLATGVYYNPVGGYTIYQDVTVPAATSLTLQFSERLFSQLNFYAAPDWRSARPQDYRVEIRNTSNVVLATPFTVNAPANATTNIGWTSHTIPLGATYAGQTIRLAFVWTIPTGLAGPGNVGLDAVSLDAIPIAVENLSISDAAVSEPAAGNVTETFLVSRSLPSNQTVTVDYATANGTAIAGQDYTATSGTLTFAPGEATKVINVIVNSDALTEVAETFTVNLSNAVNAPISDAQGIGTIRPTLSYNGRITFQSNRDGNFEVYSMMSNGSNQTRLTNSAGTDSSPSYSPDGTKIIFDSARDGDYDIFVMNADGTGQTALTNNAFADIYPSFSPDGTKILFASNRDGNMELYKADADGTNVVRLINNAADEGYGTWSPDGGSIAFQTNRDGNYEIYTMDTNGGSLQRVTTNAAGDFTPSWSPDGNLIAFESSRDGNYEIYTTNRTGTTQTRLTNNTTSDSQAVFSPDGTKISFHTFNGNYDIFTMNPDGTNITRLTMSNADNYYATWQRVAASSGTLQFQFVNSSSNESATTRTVDVTRTGGSDGTVAINYATADDTAIAGSDYTAKSGTLVFNQGETTKQISITILNDSIYELQESFALNLSSPTGGATLGTPSTHTLFVSDDDSPPQLAINNVTVNEPLSGTATANFTVTLTGATTATATVNYATADNTATTSGDYVATSGTLTFTVGETSKNIAITINSDNITEALETFRINLSGATNATYLNTFGVGTIRQQYGNGKIAFNSNRDGNLEIYSMNADGSGQTRLTNNAATDELPVWSPDGNKITFASPRGASWDVFIMNADGSNQIDLTNNHPVIENYPAMSPDGTKITYTADLGGGNNEVYVMNSDGSGQTNISSNAASDYESKWSPDGSKLVFASNRDGNYEVYSMNANGSGQTRLTNTSAPEDFPSWSPDGSKIAFSSNRDGNAEIYVMNADGSGQTRLTNNSSLDYVPMWSPDGTKLTFSSQRDGNLQVYIMNPDGSNQTRLTNNAGNDYLSSWQPVALAPSNVQFSSATYAVAENVTTTTITVTRTNGNGAGSIDYATSNGSATAGQDYAATNGTLNFAVGETSKTFTVSITDDALVEGDETINLALTNPVNILLGTPNTAVLTITDNEPPINLTINDVTVTEPFSGTIAATFTVTLSPASASTVTVNYATADNTATNPADYATNNGTLNFTAGQTSKTVTVNVNADSLAESTETFFVNLSGASGAIITDAQGIGTIQNLSGTLRAWGFNGNGQLGIGNNVSQSLPVSLSNVGDIIQIDGNSHTLALRSDGTVLSWGYNGNGQLGNGNTTTSNTPGAVNVLTNVIAISAGAGHSLALKADGTVWAWGNNSNGATGLGTFAGNTTNPTQISGLTGITAIEAGLRHSMALKSDGTVWTWGLNDNGQLGSAGGNSNIPLQVSGLTNTIAIGASINSVALKNDGTVRVWGDNTYGQFGNNTTSAGGTTPTQSTITGVTQITVGILHIVALKSDGTVWAWGFGNNGEMGNGSTTITNALPVQASIPDVTDIKAFVTYGAFARKKNGSIWAWGYNAEGQMGNGTITPQPYAVATPVQSSVGTSNAIFGAGQSGGFVSNPIVTTPIGANVKTNLGDAALTFSNVTGAGNTTITAIDAATTGLNAGSYTLKTDVQGYNLQTNATFTGNIEVCLKVPMVYSQASFFALRLLHGEGGNLIDRTSTTNYAKREVCGIVTSLSPFVLGLAPTAASVSVSGRVTAANGNGIRNIVVSLIDSNGQTRTTKTTSFGYYNFDEVPLGTAVIAVSSKRFTFADPTKILSLTDNLSDVDFTAIE